MDTEKDTGGSILSNNRIGNNNVFIAIVPLITMIGGFFLLIMLVGMVTFFIVNRSAFLAFMPNVFTWAMYLIGACIGIVIVSLAIKYILGGFIIHVVGAFIKHVIEPLRSERVHFANDNFVAYSGNVSVSHHEGTHGRSVKVSQVDTVAAPLLLPAPTTTPTSVQSFHALLERGTVQRAIEQGRMLLGYQGGTLRYGSWLDLYSCSVGGVSGSGKSTTVRFLLFQAILAGARLMMIDPHINEPENSLAAQFRMFTHSHVIKPCDGTTSEVLRRVRWLSKEMARRESTGQKTPFLVFVIDEFNEVMRDTHVKEEMSTLLLNIAQGGRKFGIFAMLIGQRWSSQDIGGADIRSSLASSLAHRFTDEDQAKKLIGSKHGAKCLDLETGHYLFRDTGGKLFEMITPECNVADGAIIQQLLLSARETTDESTVKPRETTSESTSVSLVAGASIQRETTDESTDETTKLQMKARQVITLQAQGKVKADIMRQVWGVNPGGTVAYEQASHEYLLVMQFIAEKIGA